MTTLWLLLLSHFVCDFSLQSDWVAKHKVPGSAPFWLWVLVSHAATHAAGTYLVTHSVQASVTQLAAHLLIDFFKGIGTYGFDFDQWLHIATALVIWLAFCQ